MAKIDTMWFHQQLEARNESVRGLGRFLKLDPSAVSRMLHGERKMSADEQDQIAAFFGVSIEDVARHRRGDGKGFGEMKQDSYAAGPVAAKPEPAVKMVTEADIIYKDGKRWFEGPDGDLFEVHPAYGCMKGTMTIPDDLDLTAPMDWEEEWGDKLYNE